MESPFKNDPYALVWIAFKRLYPDKTCVCEWVPGFGKTEDGEHDALGLTTFVDDGSVVVMVSSELNVGDAIEIFAHELAHVAVGADVDHDQTWQSAFDAIFEEYFKVAKELLPDMVFYEEAHHEPED